MRRHYCTIGLSWRKFRNQRTLLRNYARVWRALVRRCAVQNPNYSKPSMNSLQKKCSNINWEPTQRQNLCDGEGCRSSLGNSQERAYKDSFKVWSPRCWKSVCQALDEFEKLTSKKEKIECVKEQILIRYLGLGWEEAHHPWSKNKHIYTASELLKHLCVWSCHSPPGHEESTVSAAYQITSSAR